MGPDQFVNFQEVGLVLFHACHTKLVARSVKVLPRNRAPVGHHLVGDAEHLDEPHGAIGDRTPVAVRLEAVAHQTPAGVEGSEREVGCLRARDRVRDVRRGAREVSQFTVNFADVPRPEGTWLFSATVLPHLT